MMVQLLLLPSPGTHELRGLLKQLNDGTQEMVSLALLGSQNTLHQGMQNAGGELQLMDGDDHRPWMRQGRALVRLVMR